MTRSSPARWLARLVPIMPGHAPLIICRQQQRRAISTRPIMTTASALLSGARPTAVVVPGVLLRQPIGPALVLSPRAGVKTRTTRSKLDPISAKTTTATPGDKSAATDHAEGGRAMREKEAEGQFAQTSAEEAQQQQQERKRRETTDTNTAGEAADRDTASQHSEQDAAGGRVSGTGEEEAASPLVKATAYVAHAVKKVADKANEKLQSGIDAAVVKSGMAEKPKGRVAELLSENDPSAGKTRLPVYNTEGQETGTEFVDRMKGGVQHVADKMKEGINDAAKNLGVTAPDPLAAPDAWAVPPPDEHEHEHGHTATTDSGNNNKPGSDANAHQTPSSVSESSLGSSESAPRDDQPAAPSAATTSGPGSDPTRPSAPAGGDTHNTKGASAGEGSETTAATHRAAEGHGDAQEEDAGTGAGGEQYNETRMREEKEEEQQTERPPLRRNIDRASAGYGGGEQQ